MKHSIRTKWTLVIVLMIAGALVVCWIINNTFLDKYYMFEKQQNIENAYFDIEKYLTEKVDEENVNYELEKMSERYVIDYLVVDSSARALYTNVRGQDMLVSRLSMYLLGIKDERAEVLKETDSYTVVINNDDRFNTNYLELWGYFEKGNYYLILRSPVESIEESVALSNTFFAYVSVGVILISCLVMWLITRRITKPILELADISEKMSNLDFNVKYTRDDEDEIGVLGSSMNKLSTRLESTISELKTANNELKKDIEQKIQIDEMRKEFLANVSHELKTPIALIQGYAEGLHESSNDDAESRDFYCEVIMDEADKMSRMVKRLLELNQLEFGQNQVQMERFDIVQVIKAVVASAEIKIKQKEAVVNFAENSPIYVWADEYQIEEVITNYLSNALNHVDFDRVITITLEQKDDIVRVLVHNTGNNISEEELDKIWIKFYKVDKARTREYGGNGIGLSIVKAIMDAHNRACGVYNTEDGVTFWFELDSQDRID